MTELWTIYHEAKPPVRPAGGIVKQYMVADAESTLGSRFASMNCYYDIWVRGQVKQPKIVGFQAYRKHFNFRDHHMTGWEEVPTKTFYEYQDWLYKWDGGAIEDFLDKYDMIIPPPFDLTAQGGLSADFCRSRSWADWRAFREVMAGPDAIGGWDWNIGHVTSHWFVCKWPLFDEFMTDWWKVFKELEPRVKSEDAQGNEPYKTRCFDFLTERFFTLWLASHPSIRTKVFPLMISWEAR
jgi:hypothetical protein